MDKSDLVSLTAEDRLWSINALGTVLLLVLVPNANSLIEN